MVPPQEHARLEGGACLRILRHTYCTLFRLPQNVRVGMIPFHFHYEIGPYVVGLVNQSLGFGFRRWPHWGEKVWSLYAWRLYIGRV